MEWTVTIPAALVAALDKRAGVPVDAEDADELRLAWLTRSLSNELRQERDAIDRDGSEAFLAKLAVLPTKTKTDLEAAIGQLLPKLKKKLS